MSWPDPVERVAVFLRTAGAEARLEEFESATPSAQAAADAIGCALEQIVKSLVFVCGTKVKPGTEPATLQAWQLAAGLTGLQLIGITQPPLALAPPACDFYVGCGPPCGEPRQQHLVAAGATASRCTCLAVQQVDAHQRLLQSLMTHVVG